jgi:hypothetical protein
MQMLTKNDLVAIGKVVDERLDTRTRNLATTKDLDEKTRNLATRTDLNEKTRNLATTKDLDEKIAEKLSLESIALVVGDQVEKHLRPFDRKFAVLQTSVDSYLKRTEDWHGEFQVLDAKVHRHREILIEKGVAQEEDFSLIPNKDRV